MLEVLVEGGWFEVAVERSARIGFHILAMMRRSGRSRLDLDHFPKLPERPFVSHADQGGIQATTDSTIPPRKRQRVLDRASRPRPAFPDWPTAGHGFCRLSI